jgi:transmembrane sensor
MQAKREIEHILKDLEEAERTELLQVWRTAGSVDALGDVDVKRIDSMKTGLITGIQDDRASRLRESSVRPVRFLHRVAPVTRWSLAIAAAIVLLLGTYVTWYRAVTVYAPPGEMATVSLNDGTEIRLNSGSRLTYRRGWGVSRDVSLSGEGFFDVAHADDPFQVHTFNATVTVYGTRFNVRAWPRKAAARTDVYLEAGSVSLTPIGKPTESIMMAPGDAGSVSDSGVVSSKVAGDGHDSTAWMRKDFVFYDESVGDLLAEIERRFDVHILSGETSILQRRITGAFRQPEDAGVVLADLSELLGINYRETSDGYELYDRADR